MSRHPHADLMIAYANDTSLEIEVRDRGEWCVSSRPLWLPHMQYRIKPAPKKAYVFMYKSNSVDKWCHVASSNIGEAARIRSDLVRLDCEVTTIKEVEFE